MEEKVRIEDSSQNKDISIQRSINFLVLLMFISSLISAFGSLIPSFLPLGKIIGLFLILNLLSIIIKTLKSIDVIFFVSFFCVILISFFISHGDLSVIIENITNLTFCGMFIWKFSEQSLRKRLFIVFQKHKKSIFIFLFIFIIITAISFVLPTSFEESLQEQRFRGFSDFGSSLAGNLIFWQVLILNYFVDKKPTYKELFLYLLPFALLSTTGNRTYFISGIIISVGIIILRMRNFTIIRFAPLLIVWLGPRIFMRTSIFNRFITTGSNIYISTNKIEALSSGRLIWWKIDLNQFLSSNVFYKIFGHGFDYVYKINYQYYGLYIFAHNDYIMLLLSMGIIGLSFYLLLFGRFFKNILCFNKSRLCKFLLFLIMLAFINQSFLIGFYGNIRMTFVIVLIISIIEQSTI